ncbi:MAG: hypothetical protein FJY10_12185 [Bacteroidetes bacterium]|nr:hypothetical protein [Bacteroidota bacterium]
MIVRYLYHPRFVLIFLLLIPAGLRCVAQPEIYDLREDAYYRMTVLKDSLSPTSLTHLMQLNTWMDSLILLDSMALAAKEYELAALEADRAAQISQLGDRIRKLSDENKALKKELETRTYLLAGGGMILLLIVVVVTILLFRLRKQKIRNDYIIQEMKRSSKGSGTQDTGVFKTRIAEMEKELDRRDKLIKDFEETIRKEIEFRKKMESDYRMMIDQLRKKKG